MWNFRRNSPLLLATALRLLQLLCSHRPPAQSGKHLHLPSGEANRGAVRLHEKAPKLNPEQTESANTYNLELTTGHFFKSGGGRRGGGDAEAAKFVLVIFFVQHIPFFAAFQNLLFLRGDALADFQLDFFF